MSVTEIKTQIQHVIDNIPEGQLNDVLLILTKIQQKDDIGDVVFDNYVDVIIKENKELLQRLAQ